MTTLCSGFAGRDGDAFCEEPRAGASSGSRLRRFAVLVLAVAVAAVAVPIAVAAQSSTVELYGRNAVKDIEVFDRPADLWGNSTTLWVATQAGPSGSGSIAAFDLTEGETFGTSDQSLSFVPDRAVGPGVWSDGTTMWVLPHTRAEDGSLTGAKRIHAFTMDGFGRDRLKHIPLDDFNLDPVGLWSNGTTIWVADRANLKLFAYTLVGGARDTDKDIVLDRGDGILSDGNALPSGLWSDGTTIWVIDSDRGAYAYTLATGALDTNKRFYADVDGPNLWSLGYPAGAWSNGTTMWIGGHDTNKLYAFNMTGTRTGGL